MEISEIISKGRIKRIEDHGTTVVLWLEDDDKKLQPPVYFDHRQFQNLIDAYTDTWSEEEFVYNGEVIWTMGGDE